MKHNGNGLPDDPLWYKDAIFYELRVRSLYDSNGDGVGDFPGLTEKLDYFKELGITTLWLLPFYPSPMKDNSYNFGSAAKKGAPTRGKRRGRAFKPAHRR